MKFLFQSVQTSGKAEQEGGFSLIETLITVFLLSLMSVLIVNGMRGGGAANERARQLTEQSEIWAVQRYLRSALNGAQVLPIPGSLANFRTVMEGNSNSLVFVTSHTVPGQYSGYYVTTLTTRPNGNLLDLWIDQKLFQRHGDIFAKSRNVAPQANVLRKIAGLKIRYFGVQKQREDPVWHETWSSDQHIPDLVEISVLFPGGDQRVWPVLAASTPITN